MIFVHVLTVPISVSGWALGNYLAVIAFVGHRFDRAGLAGAARRLF
jgi:hypothetical protein